MNPIETEKGILILCSIVDISHRKRAEGNLREALQQLQIVTQNMAAGVARCSRDLRYVWVSRSYSAWLGRAQEEIAGRPIVDVIGQEGYEAIRPHIEKVLSGEKEEYEKQVTFLGAGTRWIHAIYVPTEGQNHQVDGWIAVVTDITDRHESEERLGESEERFRALVTATSDVVYRVNPDWSEMRYLRGRDFIPDTVEPSGNWLQKYIHPDDQSRVMAVIKQAIATKSVFELEHRILRTDGSLGWMFSRAVPMLNANGEIFEWFGTAKDVTSRLLVAPTP